MAAVIVPASALYVDDGDKIIFATGTGSNDSMSYKSLMYSAYGIANGSGLAAPAVTLDDSTLAGTWNGQLVDNGDGSAAILQAALTSGDAQWIWSTSKVEESGTLIGGEAGAANPAILGDIVRFDKTFTVDGTPDDATLYIAADNGCIVFVNGRLLHVSDSMFFGVDRATVKANIEAAIATDGIDAVASLFPRITEDKVTTSDWKIAKAVSIPVSAEMLEDGENTITVIGLNEEMTAEDNNGTVGTQYLNPAGVVFTLEVPYSGIIQQDVVVAKYDVAGRLLVNETFHFVAYTEIDSKGKPVISSKVAEADTVDGLADFGELAPGTYYIFEELSTVRNQVGRFRPYNLLFGPTRAYDFIIVTVEAGNPIEEAFIFTNDYMRTKVDVTKEVGFQAATATLSLDANYLIAGSEWESAYMITKEALAGAVNFDIGVVLANADNQLFRVGSLNISKKIDGGLYGLFTPNANCPPLKSDVFVSIATPSNMFSSNDIVAGTEFQIADAAALAELFDVGETQASIFINGEVANTNLIKLQSPDTFYLLFQGPAFQKNAVVNGVTLLDGDGDPIKGTVYQIGAAGYFNLALFEGDYAVTEINADGTPVSGYKAYIKTTVISKGDGDEYGPPEIRYDGTFTIYRLCDKVKVEVLNTPFLR